MAALKVAWWRQLQQVQHERQQVQGGASDAAALEAEQLQHQQVEVWCTSLTAAAGSVGQDSSGGGDDAELHSLRAQLGMACAEVARLRHELDVASCSRAAERELTGQEILRLQQELSDAVSTSSVMNSRGAVLHRSLSPRSSTARPHEDICVDNAAAVEAGEVTSSLLSQQQQQQQLCDEENEESDRCSWHSALPSSAACDVAAAGLLTESNMHHFSINPQKTPLAGDGQELKHAPYTATGSGSSSMQQYEAQLHDQADTMASLQQQLKQQQMLLASLQMRDKRVRPQGLAA